MRVPCEASMSQIGNQPIACFSSSQWLPAHFTSTNWPTCSHSISRQEGRDRSVELLLDHGADVNYLNSDYSSSLHLASQRGHGDIVGFLLLHGAAVNRPNGDGWASLTGTQVHYSHKRLEGDGFRLRGSLVSGQTETPFNWTCWGCGLAF